MRVIIIGGGIGGLTLALSLHARGMSPVVYEAARTIRPVGTGINLLPHAVSELAELGLLDALRNIGIQTRELRYLNRFGQNVWIEPRGIGAGHHVPQISVHRGRLHDLLWNAAAERLGASAVLSGMRLTHSSQDGSTVWAGFENGVSVDGDILVGCDGIHSVLRKAIQPIEKGIRWNGVQMWRGSVDWPVFEGGDTMIVAGGMDQKLVLYPIAQGADERSRLTNWVVTAQIGAPDDPLPRREDWSRPGQLDELLPHASRFSIPFIDVQSLVRSTPKFWEYPMCDRDPLSRWTDGRITLLGDAAHAMYPVGSNGASQAILDARCLADHLTSSAPGDALMRYEADRLPRTSDIVRSNRSGGPEKVIDAVSALAPDGFSNIDDVISRADLEAIVRGYARITSSLSNPEASPFQKGIETRG